MKGLVLTDISYAKESVWKKIEAFAASGGNVFYDEKTKLRPASAVPLGFAYDKTSKEPSYPENHMTALSEIAELLGKTIPPELRSSLFRLDEPTHLLVPFRLDGGEAKFIFLVNTNWKKSTECTFTVTAPGVLYDFLAKKEVPNKNTFAVEPGDWRVFLLLPEKISGVALDASVEGGKLRLSASLNGSKAPLPFRFRILAPDGSVLPSSRSASFDPEGKWREEILLSGKMDPPGEYTFELEELASGTKTQMKFRR